MKKTNKCTLVIGTLALIAACSKEMRNHAPVQAINNEQAARAALTDNHGPVINAYVKYKTIGLCDWEKKIDCVILSQGVDVTPGLITLLDAATKGGLQDVSAAFNTEEAQDMEPMLGTKLMEELRNGMYYLAKAGETASASCYYIGTTLPVTADNKVVAFQIQK